jgi:diguanylate cyclase (GGDEF)-like protein
MPARLKSGLRAVLERISLGVQVSLLSGVLCIAIVVTASLLSAHIARDQDVEQVQAEMLSQAGNLADRLDIRMFERVREFRNMAELKPLEPVWSGSAADIRSVLEQMQSTLPDYAWIGFAEPDGKVLAATKGMLEGKSVAARPWFIEGLKGLTTQDVHEAALLADKLGPNATGEPFRFVDVAIPVKARDGRLLGVLGGHMSWTWAAEIRRMVLTKLDPALRTEILVLGRDGNVLLGGAFDSRPFSPTALAAINAGKQNTFLDQGAAHEGIEAALSVATPTKGFRDYAGLGWIVVATRPLDIAFGPARALGLSIVIAGLVLAALGALLTALLTLRLTGPLRQLATSVDLIGRDSGVTMVGRGHGSSDVVRLSSSIRSLLRRIGAAETQSEAARRDALEASQRLEEKTKRFGEDLHALQVLADCDPLTGLLNRRAFQAFASDAMSYFRRYKRPIAILVIDIDLFKRVNDTFGHAAGDDVIRGVGKVVSEAARTTDKVSRFGGEEFVVLLREIDEAGLLLFAERVRAAMAAAAIAARGGAIPVTVSIGVALATENDRDIEDLIERADLGLYAAKSAGRNCVRLGTATGDLKRAA